MNSLERMQATVAFQAADRTPVVPQIFGHAARLAGVPLNDYLHDGSLLARCQIEAWKYYGGDAVFAFMDAGLETEAMGAVLNYYEEQYPNVATCAVAREEPLERLQLPDPSQAGRMPELLRSIGILRQETGGEVPVVGVVLGPMTLATQLMGIDTALELALDAPHRFEELLDFTTRLAILFGEAQLGAGAHLPMVFDPSASPVVVPPPFFRELLLPRLRRIFRAYKTAGAVVNWLHIAGPAEPILSHYPEAGVEIANLDFEVDPALAIERLPHTCVDGNIKPLLFVQGTPEAVAAEARRLLALFSRRGGFILSPGCELPLESRPENVIAMVAVAREGG